MDAAGTPVFKPRELGIGGVVDDALLLWRMRIGVLFAFVLFVFAPVDCLVSLAESLVVESAATQGPMGLLVYYGFWLAIQGVFMSAVIATLIEAVLTHHFAMTYIGQPVEWRASFRRMRAIALWAIALHAVLYPVYFLLSSLCVLPGLLFYALLFPRLAVMTLEDAGPFRAVTRSLSLIRGQWHIPVVVVIVLVSVQLLFSFIASWAELPSVGAYVTSVATGMCMTFETSLAAVLYVSCRCRHEHLDLDLLAQAVDAQGAEGGPVL